MTEGLHVWGPDGAPKLFLLHCTLAHGGAWTRVARGLSDQFRLVAPDMVGHGAGPPGDRARDYHDQATEHVRAVLPSAPVHLVGHSFAATVALRLAIESPASVASLTLIEPVLFAAAKGNPAHQANAKKLGHVGDLVADGDTEEAARVFLSVWGAGEDFDRLPKSEAARMADQMWIIPAQRAALHEDAAQLLPRLCDVRCPVLLMEGGASQPVIGVILDRLQSQLRTVQRAQIDGAGHMAPITHAAAVAEEIRRFVSDTINRPSFE